MLTKSKTKLYKFIRWTEKWTKTDMVYLMHGEFWMTAGQIAAMFSAFFLSIIYANFLPTETYGTYQYILSITNLLLIFTLSGMRPAMIQAVARKYEGTIIPATITKVKWGILGGITGILISVYYYYQNDTKLALCFLIMAFFIPFFNSFTAYTAFYHGKKLFRVSTKINFVSQFITTLVLAVTIYSTNNIFIILFTYFFTKSLLSFLIFIYTTTKYQLTKKKKDITAINYGKHLSFIGIISVLAGQIDKIIIWHYLGAAQLAVYTFATVPINQMKSLIFKNLSPLALPKLSENSTQNIKKTLPGKILKLTIITSTIAILYIITAPYLFHILFPKFTESIIYSQLLAIVLIFIPLNIISTSLTAKKQKNKLAFLNISSSILQIILYLIFIPIYGIMGLVIATIFFQIYNKLLLIFLFKKM